MMASRTFIDSLEFARSGESLQGAVDVAQMTRLADSLYDMGGSVSYRVAGGRDAQQRPRLKLSVTGEINLKCQRCLGLLPFALGLESSLLVLTATSTAQTVEIQDLDGVPADPHTDVWGLVEDEVLLAVPFAPRHAEGQCTAAVEAKEEQAQSPFAMLAQLKQDRSTK